MAARGLKTKIAWNVALLVLLSALVTDILVVMVMQNAMIRNEVNVSRDGIEEIGTRFFSDFRVSGDDAIEDLTLRTNWDQKGYLAFQVLDLQGSSIYHKATKSYLLESLNGIVNAARRDAKPAAKELDYSWNIFWWHPRSIALAVPIFIDGRQVGAIGGIISLSEIFHRTSQYHKPIFFYIILNTVILTFVGLYRIFRLYLRPIDRIVHQADDFHDDVDPFFAFRQEDNELNRLSSALNRMLTRISKDKKKLQDTVLSLEHANTQLQNAQKEILRAEKMASVGRLAAGIAHEIGNPIGIVLGYLDMLKQNDLDQDDKLDFLQRSEKEIQRINLVIRQLLDLARPQPSQFERIPVHLYIQDIVEVMRLQPMMNDIQIDLDLQAEEDSVWGNGDQLRQVFLNLLLNAADAVHSGPNARNGKILIQTCLSNSGANNHRPAIQIMLRDNGTGMTAEQLQSVFDPFFTTKEPGKGTGLGLAVSYMIVDSMGGGIFAQGQLHEGATFSIELPLLVEAPTEPNNKPDKGF